MLGVLLQGRIERPAEKITDADVGNPRFAIMIIACGRLDRTESFFFFMYTSRKMYLIWLSQWPQLLGFASFLKQDVEQISGVRRISTIFF